MLPYLHTDTCPTSSRVRALIITARDSKASCTTHKHSSNLFGHIQPYFLFNAIIRISMSGYITGLSDLFGVVVHHAGGVIHGQTDLVLPLAGLGPPQPDLVFPELTGDVGDHLSHVQTFPCAVITSVEHHTLAT